MTLLYISTGYWNDLDVHKMQFYGDFFALSSVNCEYLNEIFVFMSYFTAE